MNQQNINQSDEFPDAAEEIFFDEETVQTIPAVMPLDETPTRTAARFRKFRVPMRKADNSFNPAFLIMALLAVTALGVIAGTMLYRTSAEKSASNDTSDEPVNRTIPAQYQFVVEKPSSSSIPKDNLTSTTAPSKKNSGTKPESSEPNEENEPENVSTEETVEENKAEVPSEDDEPPPPATPNKRKEDKKQNKEKNQNAKPEPKDDGENPDEQSGDISN
jgi:type IV secretory pathway VirB10-like protein